MFKVLIAVALFAVIQGQLAGGFTNRPDLINEVATSAMVRLAVKDLQAKQNLLVSPINIVNVATQVVAGINYLIVFNARSTSSSTLYSCTAKIYQSFTGAQSVSSVSCA